MSTLAPIDTTSPIPAAVLAAAAQAEAAYKQAYEVSGDAPVSEVPGFDDAAPAAETVTQKVTPEAPPAPAPDEQSWEHKYKSMKGRYDRAAAQISTLSDEVGNLRSVIATMQSAPSTPSRQSYDEPEQRLITAEEENDYGHDFLNVVGKKAREELAPIISKYESQIAKLEERLQGVNGYVAQDARTRLENVMDSQVPAWRDVNFNPEFIQWLKLPDPYSGAIRHDLLKSAYERNDSPRVMAFFKGFLAEEAATTPANTGPDLRTSAPAQEFDKIPLETFAAPGRAKTAAATNAPAEKPSFTRAQIAKFYQDSAAGKFRGKEAEMDRIEKQIFDAEREGRIR